MTQFVVAHTDVSDGAAAGAALGQKIRRASASPDALIVFASPQYHFEPFLEALDGACTPRLMMGCSSAGEFTNQVQGTGLACAVALWAPEMHFACSVGENLSQDRHAAARRLSRGLGGSPAYGHRAALVFTDALAGHAEDFLDSVAQLTGGRYKLFGGGAGGDDNFEGRAVFCGTQVYPDAAVALEILSNKPIGVAARHGWQPTGPAYRVTEAAGPDVRSLSAMAAVEVLSEHAERTGQTLDRDKPLPFFLHNILGVRSPLGYKLRVPLAVKSDGAVTCATEIATGLITQMMTVTTSAAASAAAASAQDALGQLEGAAPAGALVFDCIATRLRMGKEFGVELAAIKDVLGDTPMAGCNTVGQIINADNQLNGFHNCTAVVCVFPV